MPSGMWVTTQINPKGISNGPINMNEKIVSDRCELLWNIFSLTEPFHLKSLSGCFAHLACKLINEPPGQAIEFSITIQYGKTGQ